MINDQNDENFTGDHDIDDVNEAIAILAFADGGANTNNWNILDDVSDNRNLECHKCRRDA